MSTVPPNPNHPQQVVVTQQPGASQQPVVINTQSNAPSSNLAPSRSSEIKLVSHSNLFYWWPVWALAFLMAAITYAEGSRMVPLLRGYDLSRPDAASDEYHVVPTEDTRNWLKKKFDANIPDSAAADRAEYRTPRMSQRSWPGVVFVMGLILTIIITNVPLRGLWSFVVIIVVIAMTLLLALLDVWDNIFRLLGNLHIHINYGGYLTLGVLLFIIWALATFLFDQRTYVIFTPGQVKVCEHIGDAEQVYATSLISLEKQRDDIFRHYVYGLGSGDLILKIGGAERREIRLPNVLSLGSRLKRVQDMLRVVATT